MTLPNYFIADLPTEARLDPALVTAAGQTLKRNRQQYLAPRSVASVVNALSELASSWLDPNFPFRLLALQLGPGQLGFSAGTLARGLDAFFSSVTRENLQALITQELGHPRRLEELAATSAEEKQGRAAFVRGPELLSHITAGTIPAPALASMVYGLLVRAAQFVKCPLGTSLLPRLFAHSLYQIEPKLGSCLEVAEWSRDRRDLHQALLAETDCLTATGTDAAIADLRHGLPRRIRFIAHGHRLSFGYIARDALTMTELPRVVANAVDDVTAWDQLGCLSPHVLYVEWGGVNSPERFAESLAEALARRELTEPRGPVPVETASVIALRRSFYGVRAAHCLDTRQWSSPDSTAWTVIYEADPHFQVSCLHRFIHVKAVDNLEEALHGADAVREHVSTVGLAAPEERAENLAMALARWGATRICPLGEMQKPPLAWRQDGRPSLGELVTWADWEQV